MAGDTVSFTGGPGSFSDKNAANGKTVTVNGITASGADAGNYTFNTIATTLANITPLAITVGATADNKIYDGTTVANALVTSTGVLAGDTVDFTSGSASFADKNVGSGKSVTVSGITASGSDAGNYTFNTTVTTAADITPLAITGTIVAGNKIYDGNTNASVSGSLTGVITGDQVGIASSGSFVDKNVGNGKTVDVNGSLTGSDAGNYVLTTNATTTANITPVVLDLTGTRVYDGTTGATASLFGNNGVLAGVNGETLTLSGSGTVANKNVGTQKPFANGGLDGFVLTGNGGALASNYTLAGGTDWLTITPATLTVMGTTTTNRVYDGTTIDALNGATLSGVFGHDDVVLGNNTTGLFDTDHVGNGKPITTAMTISGDDAGNYVLVQPTGLTANITPRPIVVQAIGTNRMYNGQVGDTVQLISDGILPGDKVSFIGATATFADPNVGNDKTVTVTGIAAVGADAGDYLVIDPVTTTVADITSAGFTGTGVQGSWIAQMQDGMQPLAIATPYGSSDMQAVGVFTGNQKLRHRPIERNRARSDFHSGLSLELQNGGVRLPTDASP